ncbi:MAG: hypothetical protein C4525_08570 [Desulfarculus sp.]|nr:MAG: hypothetical protein C4525_08570 [Desulfarculus sp.]
MRPVFCFIDDADFELDTFRENAAEAFQGVEFVYARDFADAQRKLEGRRCLCFLLDIYGAAPGSEPGELPQAEDLAPALGQGFAVEELYQDLPGEGSARDNQFLRRLYARVQAAQKAFTRAAIGLGQGPSFGLESLARVREHHPWAATLGYSRKALYGDAAAMCAAGAEGVLQKPQGADDEAIAQATRRAAPGLARSAFAAVNRRLACLAGALGLRLCREGVSLNLAEVLGEALALLGGDGAGPPTASRDEVLDKFRVLRLKEMELAEADLGLILAVWDWLGRET